MKCEQCGTQTTNPKFCNLSCANRFAGKARGRKRTPKPKVTCGHCGALTTNPSYCSRSCSATESNKTSPKRHTLPHNLRAPCVVCGAPSLKRSDICSPLCRNIKRILDGTAGHVALKSTLLQIYGQKCSICGLTEWLGKPIAMVMDHIDGNPANNAWENVRLVCGNCDMQLPTYKSKNKNGGRPWRNQRYAAGKSY